MSNNLTNFTFTTIGKQPDLLKRISAPNPNHLYQENEKFTDPPSPSPSHHQESPAPPLRPTLLQVLAVRPDESMAHLPPESTNHTPSLLGIFDKRAAALFAAPNCPETSSQFSAPLRQASASRDELMDKSRLTSPDFTGSMELVYPPTEPAASPAPGFPVIPSSCAADVHSSSVPNSTPSSILTSLEQDIQALYAKSLLSLENARKAGALAQRSLATANESVAIAQENASLAQATKDLVDRLLIRLQLVLRCKDEATVEQSCNLECELEEFRRSFTEPARDTQPTGLPPYELYAMAAELTKKMREYDSRRGLRKRKRSQDNEEAAEGNDLPYLPHKERRIEQGTMQLDLALEMEAEAARKAWGQEAERRSMVPLDIATLGQQEQRTATETRANDPQQVKRASETGLLNQLDQAPGPASQITEQPVAALEPDLSSHQGVSATDNEDALQAQRRRELEERKLEIARFHIRERELQELQTKRKEMQKKDTAALIESQKKGRIETGSIVSSAPPTTLAPSNVTGSKDALPSTAQRRTAAGDISKKKEVEQRLAMEKQQASAAVRPRPAQAGDVTQMLATQNHVDQPGIRAKERFPANQSDLQNRSQPSGDERGDTRQKQQEISEQQRNAEAETVVKTRTQSAKFKERTNSASDASKPSKPKAITAPNVGNVVAQQTLATSPKMKGKKSRNPQTPSPDTGDSSTQKSGPVPPVQGVGPHRPHQALPVVNQTAPKNVRLSSVPPIECIIEPSSSDTSKMETRLRPISQDRSGDSQRALHTKSSGTINVSPEAAQPANPSFVRNSLPGTTGQSTSGHTARLPRVSTNTVVPKVEIQSPTIAQSTTIQHSLPPRPPTPNSNMSAPQMKTVGRPTPDDSQFPHDDRLQQTSEDAGVLDKNRSLNTSLKKSVSSTSPPALPVHRNLFPQDGRSTDMARNSQAINYEAQRTNQQNDPPPSHMTEPLNAHAYLREARRGWIYERSSISPPRSIGVKRPRVSDRLDDLDGRHWSPGQERLGRRDRLAGRYNRRTPSGSPPLRFRGDSPPRPLLDRLEETQDPSVYRLNNGGETYRPLYVSPVDATDWDMQRRRDNLDGYPGPSADSRHPELLDRFSNTTMDGSDHPRQVRTGPQHPKRQNGTAPRGAPRRGRRGGTLSLEQRLS